MTLSRIDYLLGTPRTTEEIEVDAIAGIVVGTMRSKPDALGEKELVRSIRAVLSCCHSSVKAEQIGYALSILSETVQVHYSLQEVLHLFGQIRAGSSIQAALLEIEKSPAAVRIINSIK